MRLHLHHTHRPAAASGRVTLSTDDRNGLLLVSRLLHHWVRLGVAPDSVRYYPTCLCITAPNELLSHFLTSQPFALFESQPFTASMQRPAQPIPGSQPTTPGRTDTPARRTCLAGLSARPAFALTEKGARMRPRLRPIEPIGQLLN
ncbi:hypothetical protein [Spirosoma luteolum]